MTDVPQNISVLPGFINENYYTTFLKNPNARSSSEKFIDNPIITDVTQVEQTDLKHIFNQNPDLSGLAMVLDDKARDDRLSSIAIEDFLIPKDHYDIFDICEFVDNAKAQFNKLPISFRMAYDNDPLKFCKAIDKNESAVIADLEKYFAPLKLNNDSAIPPVGEPLSSGSTSQTLTPSNDAGSGLETSTNV